MGIDNEIDRTESTEMAKKRFYLSEFITTECPEAEGFVMYPQSPVSEKEEDKAFYSHLAVLPEQTHSINVGIVENQNEEFAETDALITFKRNLPIGIITADCVPILLFAPDIEAVAAVHAGWKGTLGGIIDRVLDILIGRGAEASKIRVWFGPSISMRNYEVDIELALKFKEAGFGECIRYFQKEDNGKPHIDLQGVNRERMIRRGLIKENINLSESCTYGNAPTGLNPVYQSYRRNGERSGRILTCIRMV